MTINEFLLAEFDAEMKSTRATLERVPADKPEFAPHPKSMPLGRLAPHVAELPGFGLTILTTPELDFSQRSFKPLRLESAAQLVRVFEEGAAKTRNALAGLPESAWDDHWKLAMKGQGDLRGLPLPGVPRDVSQSPGASPGPTGRLSAPERCTGSVHLRAVGGRGCWVLVLTYSQQGGTERSRKRGSIRVISRKLSLIRI